MHKGEVESPITILNDTEQQSGMETISGFNHSDNDDIESFSMEVWISFTEIYQTSITD